MFGIRKGQKVMASFIPENIINEIHDKLDIVEVVSGYIPLKRSGRNFKANCPFHHEKTPSFMVNPDKQIYHCFGCGEGGNVFSFIMKHERMEFVEVIRMLADKTGVAIPENTAEVKEKANLAEIIYKVNEAALNFFHNNLLKNATALSYIKKRNISEASINEFKIGYALNSWDGLLNYLRGKGFKENAIKEAGLIISKENKSYYDRFRNRVMFPVFDIRNNIIGFGGRAIDNTQEPKYLNSPETQVYLKGKNLYGLNFSKSHIREMDNAILVEGYLDLISPYQYGIKNIIASCGTALTADHVRLVKRYTENITVIYDSDKAGELATLRSLDILLSEDINVKVVRLPEGFDPDGFVHKFGGDKFNKEIANSKGLFDYKLGLLSARYNKSKPEEKVKIINEMLPTVNKINNEILKLEYIKRLSENLGVNQDILQKEIKKIKRDYEYNFETKPELKEKFDIRPAEKLLLEIMITDIKYLNMVKEKLTLDDFQNKHVRRIADVLFNAAVDNNTLKPDKLMNYFDDKTISRFISEIVSGADISKDKEKCLNDCISWIKADAVKNNLEILRTKIAEAQHRGDEEEVISLVTKYSSLIKNKKIGDCGVERQFT